MILATKFTFIVERSWKNMYFHPKLAWPPATYDVISRNHSNWPSLNLSQKVREGRTNNYWKRPVLMLYQLKKPFGGCGIQAPPLSPHPLVSRRVNFQWTKISYQNNFDGYKFYKSYELTPKEKVKELQLNFTKWNLTHDDFTSVFSICAIWNIFSRRLPYEIVYGVIKDN